MHHVSLDIAHDHPAFDGHFPGQPLLPGVLLLAHALEAVLAVPALRARLGAAPRIASAKFLSPVRPGDRIDVQLDDSGPSPSRLAFEVRCGARVAASGQFEASAA